MQNDQYHGKTIARFKDELGGVLEDLDMQEFVKIEFTDGTSLCLQVTHYGEDSYICEVDCEEGS